MEIACFYDASGVDHMQDGHTKCLKEKDVEEFDFKTDLGKKIKDATAQKIAFGYVPPITTVSNIDFGVALTLMRLRK